MDEFRAGVTASLRSWSALRTAVEAGWGGANSQQKAEDLRSNIYEHFNGSAVPPKHMSDVVDLEDALAIFMEEEFSLTLEDGSEKQIADIIWRLYATCATGDLTLAQQVIQAAEQAVSQEPGVAAHPVVQSSENDDDDDDEEMADTVETDPSTSLLSTASVTRPPFSAECSMAEYGFQPLFGPLPKTKTGMTEHALRQLGEAVPAQVEEATMDEDGFAHVVSKRKSKPRKPE